MCVSLLYMCVSKAGKIVIRKTSPMQLVAIAEEDPSDVTQAEMFTDKCRLCLVIKTFLDILIWNSYTLGHISWLYLHLTVCILDIRFKKII